VIVLAIIALAAYKIGQNRGYREGVEDSTYVDSLGQLTLWQ
jgi:hypothetical protein